MLFAGMWEDSIAPGKDLEQCFKALDDLVYTWKK